MALSALLIRLEQDTAAAKATATATMLNPDFPYTVIPFSPAAFGLISAEKLDTDPQTTTT